MLKLLNFKLDDKKAVLVFERFHQNLNQVIMNKDVDLGIEQALRIAFEVAKGMDYLHSRDPPVLHRDLKSLNILVRLLSLLLSGFVWFDECVLMICVGVAVQVSEDLSRVVLCDFGLAKVKTQSKSKTGGLRGTVRW